MSEQKRLRLVTIFKIISLKEKVIIFVDLPDERVVGFTFGFINMVSWYNLLFISVMNISQVERLVASTLLRL